MSLEARKKTAEANKQAGVAEHMATIVSWLKQLRNPAFELLKSIPFKKTFKEMFVEDKKDNPTEDNFEAVK